MFELEVYHSFILQSTAALILLVAKAFYHRESRVVFEEGDRLDTDYSKERRTGISLGRRPGHGLSVLGTIARDGGYLHRNPVHD